MIPHQAVALPLLTPLGLSPRLRRLKATMPRRLASWQCFRSKTSCPVSQTPRNAAVPAAVKEVGPCCAGNRSAAGYDSFIWTSSCHPVGHNRIKFLLTPPKGTAEISYAYLKEHGIASEWTYPYTSYFGEDDFNCSTMRAQPAAQITGCCFVLLPLVEIEK